MLCRFENGGDEPESAAVDKAMPVSDADIDPGRLVACDKRGNLFDR
jgi:hypothetical protein